MWERFIYGSSSYRSFINFHPPFLNVKDKRLRRVFFPREDNSFDFVERDLEWEITQYITRKTLESLVLPETIEGIQRYK